MFQGELDLPTFVRTSLRKNPEEWYHEKSFVSRSEDSSTLHVFTHEPTKYKLLLIHAPESEVQFEDGTVEETPEALFMQILPEQDYVGKLLQNGGSFSPDPEELYEVHMKSSIVGTLGYILNISYNERYLETYKNFFNHVRIRSEKHATTKEEDILKE